MPKLGALVVRIMGIIAVNLRCQFVKAVKVKTSIDTKINISIILIYPNLNSEHHIKLMQL